MLILRQRCMKHYDLKGSAITLNDLEENLNNVSILCAKKALKNFKLTQP